MNFISYLDLLHKNSLAEVPSGHVDHVPEPEDLAAGVWRLQLEEAGPAAVGDQVVAHELAAEVGEGDRVLDEHRVVRGLGHQGAETDNNKDKAVFQYGFQ